MDGLISLIIFFIISSFFSGKKKDNKKKNSQNESENLPKEDTTNPNDNQWMHDVWNEIKEGPVKDLLSKENIEGLEKKVKSIKNKSRNKNEKVINQSNKSVKQKNETLYNKQSLNYDITAESAEGKSLNQEYIKRKESSSNPILEPTRKTRKKDLFRNQNDLKRAVIMKEIIDKPLSVRNLRKF